MAPTQTMTIGGVSIVTCPTDANYTGHVNFAYRSLDAVQYQRFTCDRKIFLMYPDQPEGAKAHTSEHLLMTAGVEKAFRYTRGGAVPSLSHCAYFHTMQRCDRGETCANAHVVCIDPEAAEGARAPKRSVLRRQRKNAASLSGSDSGSEAGLSQAKLPQYGEQPPQYGQPGTPTSAGMMTPPASMVAPPQQLLPMQMASPSTGRQPMMPAPQMQMPPQQMQMPAPQMQMALQPVMPPGMQMMQPAHQMVPHQMQMAMQPAMPQGMQMMQVVMM